MLYFACFALGFIACALCYALAWWRDNQDKQLPPLDGHIVVTRKDGSQHYLRMRAAQPEPDYGRIYDNPINAPTQQSLVVE
jgi:hypothetical protein